MPIIKYQDIKIGPDRLALIEKANEIVAEYEQQGYNLTLRQIYYQFVSRDWIPNNMRSYKNLGDVLNDGRMAGLMDWNSMVDRTRELVKLATWESPQDIVESCAKQFRFDKWEDQPVRIEVFIEKDALSGVIERVCNENQVPYLSCRGYTSQSEMWGAAQRLRGYIGSDQEPLIIHLGDHDPSGIDMSRDIQDRLDLFVGTSVRVERIALNRPQIDQYNPPPNPAKITDSRARGYIAEHGAESWELDALQPSVINGLIQDVIIRERDAKKWKAQNQREEEARENLQSVSDNWDKIMEHL